MDLDFEFDLIEHEHVNDRHKQRIISYVQIESEESSVGRLMAFKNYWIYLNGQIAENKDQAV
jgi:hypothetical protein